MICGVMFSISSQALSASLRWGDLRQIKQNFFAGDKLARFTAARTDLTHRSTSNAPLGLRLGWLRRRVTYGGKKVL